MAAASSSSSSACFNCAYWYYTPMKVSGVSDLLGFCRVRAPSNNNQLVNAYVVNNWPYTSSKSWCGEWLKK